MRQVQKCPAPDMLSAFARGELAHAQSEAVAAHLEACETCWRLVEVNPAEAALADDLKWVGELEEQTVVDVNVPLAQLSAALPEYEIIREIGRGGMGIVFEARQIELDRRVALKVLPALLGAVRPDAIARFRREVKLAAGLEHTNIIGVYDFGQVDGTLYYTMPLIEGRSLRDILHEIEETGAIDVVIGGGSGSAGGCHAATQRRSDEASARPESRIQNSQAKIGVTRLGSSSATDRAYYRRVAEWIADVAEALDYAHERGVIHRDVKPSNLLLSTDGRMMISDFGLAKAASVATLGGSATVTTSRAVLGTARYMSPEQVGESGDGIDRRVDVYGLGATLYELLAFRPMFAATDDREVLDCVLNEEPTAPRRFVRQVPWELETICLKAVEKRRDARYATAKELADDLRRWLLHLPIYARRPSLPLRVGKFVRRRKLPVTLGAALLIVATTTVMITVQAVRGNQRAAEFAAQVRSQRVALLRAEAADAFLDQRYDSALAMLEKALRDAPEDPELQRERAWMLRHLGREAEAAKLLEAICAKAPDDWVAHQYLAMLYREWDSAPPGKLEEHVRILNESVPDTSQALCALALAEPDHHKAIDLLNRAYAKDPRSLGIVLQRSHRYAELGDWESKLHDAERAVTMAPRAAIAHSDRGRALLNLGRYDEAEQAYGRAIELDPKQALYWHHRSLARSGAGKFDLALSDATRAIELDETLARAYIARARAHRGRGVFDAALEDCNRGIALDPGNFNFYIDRSALFHQLGRYEDMLVDSTLAVELAPKDPRGYRNRIAALATLGRLERAVPDTETYAELWPDDLWSHETRVKLTYRLQRFDDAISSLSRVIELTGGEDADAFLGRGQLFLITGRPDLALADLTRSIELDPDRRITRAYRAAAYAGLNQIDLALGDLSAIDAKEGTLPAYVALWRYALLAEHGRPAEAEETLRAAQQIHASVWTDQLIGFMAGNLCADDLLEAAANDDERAEAHYYRGMHLLLDGQPAAARAELTACTELNCELVETIFARGLLKQMDESGQPPDSTP